MPTLAIELLVAVMPVAVTLPPMALCTAVAVAIVVGLAVLVAARPAIFKTTLASAWWWSAIALVAWSAVEATTVSSYYAGSKWMALRLAAVALSLCPVVSLFGAKRPQSGPWNFVVVSLWAILALPAAESLLLRGGNAVTVGMIRGWFWLLVVLGPINFVPTRFWLSAILLSAGQIIALSPHLPMIHRPILVQSGLIGLLLAAGAIVAAWFRACRPSNAANGFDRAWLNFRDMFGLLWGLRVQERVNAAGKQLNWDFELTWSGFRRGHEPIAEFPKLVEPTLNATLRGLLRRFEA